MEDLERAPTTAPVKSEYDTQAEAFLTDHGLKFRATLSDSKTPAWADDEKHGHHYRVTISHKADVPRESPGASRRLTFDFWGSIADAEKLATATRRKKELTESIKNAEYHLSPIQAHGFPRNELLSQDAANKREHLADLKARLAGVEKDAQDAHPSAYDVLACISSDACAPETFADFCDVYGYERDSIKALQTFRRASAFAKRLRQFFTEAELSALTEIR